MCVLILMVILFGLRHRQQKQLVAGTAIASAGAGRQEGGVGEGNRESSKGVSRGSRDGIRGSLMLYWMWSSTICCEIPKPVSVYWILCTAEDLYPGSEYKYIVPMVFSTVKSRLWARARVSESCALNILSLYLLLLPKSLSLCSVYSLKLTKVSSSAFAFAFAFADDDDDDALA
ncbi:hypothetical protein KQX54_001861 [Cotesia glomerata]|uniref:Uncharacterized protein n=1 Tax=Cotesia glomerata TaxID=32391 RepID=A0AAV7I3S6_COTGL|nr:hypothetical protein KQX54_001861 [Cotesia glomerata]